MNRITEVYHAEALFLVTDCSSLWYSTHMLEQRQQTFVIMYNLATIFLWAAFLYVFFSRGEQMVPWTVVELYLLLLTYYAGDKEIRRWHHSHNSRRVRGEVIVVGWAVTILLMFGAEIFGGAEHGYIVPQHLPLTVGGVVLIYLVTQYLKAEYRRGFSIEHTDTKTKKRKTKAGTKPKRRPKVVSQ